ncbi:ATP-binding protein, partial [Acidithiobacillus ferrivorans]|uniref:ATP-binding protein n=1 Tax=Acidithiobacillus ferrivorans TaxID=160808 RepID=UPI000ADA2F51
ARATGSFDRRFRQLAKVSLMIIDDFGLKPLRSPHDEDFHDLIAERYERVSTMLTSNLDFTEWGDIFPANRMLGVATIDRLRHGAYRLILEGESFRAPRPLQESLKNTIAKGAKNTHS